MENEKECPKCGSEEVIPIVYGCSVPIVDGDAESLEEKARRGEVYRGGCQIIGHGCDFDLACRSCDFKFYDLEEKSEQEIKNAIDWMKTELEQTRENLADTREQASLRRGEKEKSIV